MYEFRQNSVFRSQESAAQRRHERLSVQPVLSISRGFAPGLSRAFGVSILNTGIGPATLRDVALYSADLEFVADLDVLSGGIGEINRSIRQYFGLPSGPLNLGPIRNARTLPAGDGFPLVTSPGGSQEWNDRFADAVRDMNVVVCYCSLYDECWVRSALQVTVSPHVVVGDPTGAGLPVVSCELGVGPNGFIVVTGPP